MIGQRIRTASLHATRLALIVLFTFSVTDVIAQTPETLRQFDEGNKFYTSGEYQKAILNYERALESGFASPEIYYNLGNAYFRMDELGRAMLNYKRAEQLSPAQPELNHSLALTNSRLVDQFSRLPEPFWVRISQQFYTRTLTKPLSLAGLALYVLGLGLVGFQLWSGQSNAWIRRAYTALLVIGIPLLLGGLLTSYKTSNQVAAVVIAEQTPLRSGPGLDEPTDLQVHEGLVVTVDQGDDEWIAVTLPNGISGWVSAETIVII